MLRIMLFTWKRLFRDKTNTFWILLFPIVLGSLFQIAFGNFGESENMSVIPVACVMEQTESDETFTKILKQLSSGEDAFLRVTECTDTQARKMLSKKEVVGILYSGNPVRLSVSENMKTQKIQQSILKTFVDRYNMQQAVFYETMQNAPQKLNDMMQTLQQDISYNPDVSLSRHPEQSPFTQYFFNLLAMACLFTSVGGILVACHNQPNLSDLAKRVAIAPTHKPIAIIAELLAVTIYEFILNSIGFLYVSFVLRIQLADRMPLTLLTMFVGCCVGVSLGFFIGCFGHGEQSAKQGTVFAVTMPLCFLSGLMIAEVGIMIENHAPIINRINPAMLLTDSFYRLSQYDNLNRYYTNMVTLIGLTILFNLMAFFMTRRKTYAEL
ncbi:MAG: ABC transporter permease [Lachnospiraceae bacterium]|nr:ABC transporter permease [Lachnospiraceae bacterium]